MLSCCDPSFPTARRAYDALLRYAEAYHQTIQLQQLASDGTDDRGSALDEIIASGKMVHLGFRLDEQRRFG